MVMIIICLVGTMLNIGIYRLCFLTGIPLYLDTILTISVTLTGGLFWGVLCGALTNFIHHTFWGWGWEGYLFILCNAATALVTWLFMRLFPRELNLYNGNFAVKSAANSSSLKSSRVSIVMDRVIVLIIFSFALCLAMSFLGGFIAATILTMTSSYNFRGSGITALFSATMFTNSPVYISEIVSRIPVNIVDRLISAFAGYGIALCARLSFMKPFYFSKNSARSINSR